MSYIQQYPLERPLERIRNHEHLPPDAELLGQIKKGEPPYKPSYYFLKRGNKLSILVAYTMKLTSGEKYVCHQYDFPLKVLTWFPKALDEFRKPPAEGGLHAGGMISKDENVDGEMLAVGSTTQGYNITNWSRDSKGIDADAEFYEPTTINFDCEFLYDLGGLALWKKLGARIERGESARE